MRDETKGKAVLAAGLLALWLAGCRGGAPTGTAAKPESRATAETSAVTVSAPMLQRAAQFDHHRAEHQQQPCTQCHRRDEKQPAQTTPERPYHDACAGCHAQEDYLRAAAPAPLCRVCHGQEAVLGAAEKAVLTAFPGQLRQFGLKPFSHQHHLDPQRWPANAPAQKCVGCHRFEGRAEPASFPRHTECYTCHVHTAGQKLGDCGACHTSAATAMRFEHGAGAPSRLYNFTHAVHFRQTSIGSDCAVCHKPLTTAADTQSDIARMRTPRGQRHQSACWTCHVQMREPVCTKCHSGGPPANF